LYSEGLTKEAVDRVGNFNIGGQIIQNVKYADDLTLMPKEETALQGMIGKLIEIVRCYGIEMNVDKTKVLINTRQTSPITVMTGQKQMENVKYFKYLGSILRNYGRGTRELNSGLP
jgi:ribosome-interacting GTPase 1